MACDPLDDPTGCAARIAQLIDDVFARLGLLGEALAERWQRAPDGRAPAARDLAALRSRVAPLLGDPHGHLQGMGVMLEADALHDRTLYGAWWQRASGGRPVPLPLSYDPCSEHFYDYRRMPWFAGPRHHGRDTLTGPYIDLYGQDMYVLTFARPVFVGERFVGIAGADVALARFERLLVSALLRLPHEALVVSAEGRVIAANTADWVAGELAPAALAETHALDLGPADTPWRLVQLDRPRLLAGAA